jgi:hypothetical protein
MSQLFKYPIVRRYLAIFVQIETSSSMNATGVQIPNYPLATGDLIRSIEHSGSVVATSREWVKVGPTQGPPASPIPESK